MLRLTQVVGTVAAPEIAEALHDLQHAGRVETIMLESRDAARHRLRVATDRGTDCAIALARGDRLANGTVLLLDEERAIVVRLTDTQWLSFRPADIESALELGHAAGNAHWRVRIENNTLHAALEGPEENYHKRVDRLVEAGRVKLVDVD